MNEMMKNNLTLTPWVIGDGDSDADLSGMLKFTLLAANGQAVKNRDGSEVSGGIGIVFDALDEDAAPPTAGQIIGDQGAGLDDTLAGTAANDLIDAKSGDDTINGGDGNDNHAGGTEAYRLGACLSSLVDGGVVRVDWRFAALNKTKASAGAAFRHKMGGEARRCLSSPNNSRRNAASRMAA